MYRFDFQIHARPSHAAAGEPFHRDGQSWPTLVVRGSRDAQPAWVTFDEAMDALSNLPRMYIEPDGSLLWTAASNSAERWQVDGNLYDGGRALAYVDLKGTCPVEVFDALLGCLGWPQVPLVFQLRREGVFVDESVARALSELVAR